MKCIAIDDDLLSKARENRGIRRRLRWRREYHDLLRKCFIALRSTAVERLYITNKMTCKIFPLSEAQRCLILETQ